MYLSELIARPATRLLARLLPEQRAGTFGLTVLTPIRFSDPRSEFNHRDAIFEVLHDLGKGTQSPFARVPGTHMARWVVIEDLPYLGLPAAEDHLRQPYLLFTSNFDGDLDGYLDSMWEQIRDEIERLYVHCDGFERVQDAATFRAYMRACKLPTTFYFPAYPGLRLDHALRAIDAQRRVVRFIVEQQARDAAAPVDADRQLKRAFDTFIAEVRRAPTPTPGES